MRLMLVIFIVISLFAVSGYSQETDQADQPATYETKNGVLMLEEILIQVSPELPTVVVTIPRQKPEIAPVSIQSPRERMISSENEQIKPDLTKTKVSKIKEPEKMLARQRIR